MAAPDVDVRRIAQSGAAIAAAVVIAVGSAFALLHVQKMPTHADRARAPHAAATEGAQLQSAPQLDLARYRAEKAKLLQSTGWVDRSQGIARIPIAQAMQLLAASHAASAARSAR